MCHTAPAAAVPCPMAQADRMAQAGQNRVEESIPVCILPLCLEMPPCLDEPPRLGMPGVPPCHARRFLSTFNIQAGPCSVAPFSQKWGYFCTPPPLSLAPLGENCKPGPSKVGPLGENYQPGPGEWPGGGVILWPWCRAPQRSHGGIGARHISCAPVQLSERIRLVALQDMGVQLSEDRMCSWCRAATVKWLTMCHMRPTGGHGCASHGACRHLLSFCEFPYPWWSCTGSGMDSDHLS
jgi:hypothetical protein